MVIVFLPTFSPRSSHFNSKNYGVVFGFGSGSGSGANAMAGDVGAGQKLAGLETADLGAEVVRPGHADAPFSMRARPTYAQKLGVHKIILIFFYRWEGRKSPSK